ncbi:MAG: hypothetical protein Fur0037_13750 [Planctomycetota bacterium]
MTPVSECAAPAMARVAELIASRKIEAIVATGACEEALALAELGPPVLAIDVDPERVAALRRGAEGLGNVHVALGHSPRVLADHRRQLPPATLYWLGANGLPPRPVREEILQIPRGKGAIAVVLSEKARGHADLLDALYRWSPDHHVEMLEGGRGPVLLALPRPAVHVTFLIEEYTFDYGRSGISINLDNLVETLRATGLATFDVVHYDRLFHEGRKLTASMISRPPGADRHVIVATYHYHSPSNPDPSLLRSVQREGSKIVYVWLDKKISRSTPEYHELADLNVVLDGNDFDLPNAWPIYTPKNPNHFNDPGIERDVDVSLVGEVRYLSQRKAFVEMLERERRIDVRIFPTSAADTGVALSVAEYARLFQRSKISLALTKDSSRQLKGRVFEIAHCGALLLCDVNHHVAHYFDPGRDCVAFTDYEDMIEKCLYYLGHDAERMAIARSGYMKAKSYYNHEVFWRSLLARVGASASSFHAEGRG